MSTKSNLFNDEKPDSFRSRFEEKLWDVAKTNGKDLVFEPKTPRITYTIPYRYLPDFLLPNGVLVEAKGYLRPRDRTKMRKVKEDNPTLDIRFVFMDANKRLTKAKNSEMYWQWAERLGFPWAEGTIPLAWWKEKRKKKPIDDT